MARLLFWVCMARFGHGGSAGWAALSCCQKLPPCPIEPMPASSKVDPLLTKASGITYVNREKKLQWNSSEKRDVTARTLQTSRSEKKRGKEERQTLELRIPCNLW